MAESTSDKTPDIASLLASAPPDKRFDTELLIAHAMGWSRAKVLAFNEVKPEESQVAALQTQLHRLHSGEPLAYLTGEREFFSLLFDVNPSVLIPRADTELLVELALAQSPANARVIDMGTGSGAIAVSLKHARPDLDVTASDKSAAALAVAEANAKRHDCQINFVLSDWYQNLTGQFDIIISNPPYLAVDDAHLNALQYEPREALIAGAGGLDDYRKIAAGAVGRLTADGALFVEQGADQADAVVAVFTQAGLANTVTYDDLAGHRRVTRAQPG